jgi:hypothetical protein
MRPRRTHYVSLKLDTRIRPEKGGYGVFATQPILAGELVVVWGGDVMTSEQLDELATSVRRHSIQIEDNLYLVPHQLPEPGDFINHSCDPNVGLSGQVGLISLRKISIGEEICYDYAMSDGSTYDEFICSCGTDYCRSKITGNDWALADLQIRYAGFFSPYLQRRIDDAVIQKQQQPRRHSARRGSKVLKLPVPERM